MLAVLRVVVVAVQKLLAEHPVHVHAAEELADVRGVLVGLGIEEPSRPALVDSLPLASHSTHWEIGPYGSPPTGSAQRRRPVSAMPGCARGSV